jgi:hypothetical protein
LQWVATSLPHPSRTSLPSNPHHDSIFRLLHILKELYLRTLPSPSFFFITRLLALLISCLHIVFCVFPSGCDCCAVGHEGSFCLQSGSDSSLPIQYSELERGGSWEDQVVKDRQQNEGDLVSIGRTSEQTIQPSFQFVCVRAGALTWSMLNHFRRLCAPACNSCEFQGVAATTKSISRSGNHQFV